MDLGNTLANPLSRTRTLRPTQASGYSTFDPYSPEIQHPWFSRQAFLSLSQKWCWDWQIIIIKILNEGNGQTFSCCFQENDVTILFKSPGMEHKDFAFTSCDPRLSLTCRVVAKPKSTDKYRKLSAVTDHSGHQTTQISHIRMLLINNKHLLPKVCNRNSTSVTWAAIMNLRK